MHIYKIASFRAKQLFASTSRHSHFEVRSTRPDAHPRTSKRVFLPITKKPVVVAPPPPPSVPAFEVKTGVRTNEFGIQMVSKSIYEKIFPGQSKVFVDPKFIKGCKESLEKHGMVTKETDYTPDVDFQLPPLCGKDIEEHFEIIGEQQVKPYRELVLELLKFIPEPPEKWEMQLGWTRYIPGKPPESVPYPCEEAIVFDIEVCVSSGKSPTLATAVSNKAWYGWISQSLIDGSSKPITNQYNLESLIPLESIDSDKGLKLTPSMEKPKIVVGHNVSYDRIRVKEQYWLQRTGTRFIDTMSLHICVSGLSSYQRAVLKSGTENEEDELWKNSSSLNSLSEVLKLYCGKSISKATRDIFVEGSLSDVQNNFQEVMQYCCGDVTATYNVLKVIFPLFLERFPHPVTLSGMLELSTAYLPVNSNWNRYIANSEQSYEDLEIESRILLARRADQACQLLSDEKYKEDLWLWDEDWSVKEIKLRKTVPKNVKEEPPIENKDEPDPLEVKFKDLYASKIRLPKVKTHLPGYPNWYRKLCSKPDSIPDWIPGPHLISTSMQITPKLLSLTWEGYPLHHMKENGWGFLLPYTDDLTSAEKLPLEQLLKKCPLLSGKPSNSSIGETFTNIHNIVQDNLMKKEYYSKLKKDKTGGLYKGTGIWCNVDVDNCCYFFKLPHKNGPSNNVGNPLAKDFLSKFSENVLAGDTESAERVLSIARMLSYWRNNRDRIFDQMVVWLSKKNLPKRLASDGNLYGAILPQVVVCGTLTRRAVERTWMTASNADLERVGSELRPMIQAPPGYSIVGADVDSQELWLASVIGDASHARIHGATPFGWMNLSGSKTDGTDMHSITAKAVGISRDHAKVINYARIYGAGQNLAERLLKQFNPSISESEARNKARKMFELTKGKQFFRLREEFIGDLPDQAYSKWQVFETVKTYGKTVDELFLKPQWVGGTESAMFNRLETIANSPTPCTPFLNCRLSRALEPASKSDDRYLPTRINWVVQSGAVDFLHLMLVCMKWIMGSNARFCLSFHDEVRYIVPERLKYQAALAMHVTNLLTRAFCSSTLGIKDLPQSVAFFSSVEVDTVLRKDAKHNCKTPSNPHGLENGYNVPNGESLDVFEAVEKAGGKYSSWYKRLQK